MVDLHRNLLAGTTGRSIVGGLGVILFLLSATRLLMRHGRTQLAGAVQLPTALLARWSCCYQGSPGYSA